MRSPTLSPPVPPPICQLVLMILVSLLAGGCGGEVDLQPPDLHPGRSVCASCRMIINDGRHAAARLVQVEGRPVEGLLYDDPGCLFTHRRLDTASTRTLVSYVRDYVKNHWVRSTEATFLYSRKLHTPMGSGVAAFSDRASALAAQDTFGGELLTEAQVDSLDRTVGLLTRPEASVLQ